MKREWICRAGGCASGSGNIEWMINLCIESAEQQGKEGEGEDLRVLP